MLGNRVKLRYKYVNSVKEKRKYFMHEYCKQVSKKQEVEEYQVLHTILRRNTSKKIGKRKRMLEND